MKNKLYAGILSGLLSSCAAPQTTFVDYPVVIDGVKGVYSKDSNGNCYLKIPDPEGREWKFFNEQCDETTDSVALSFQENFIFYHDRKELITTTSIDSLFQKATEYVDKKHAKRGYNDIPF